MRLFHQAALMALAVLTLAPSSRASPYIEWGTGVGTMAKVNDFFGLPTSAASSTSLGFVGTFNFYVPVTSRKNFFHFDLGLQNKLTLASTSSHSLALATSSVAARFEFYRFYVGAGYGVFTFGSTDGVMALKRNLSYRSYTLEGGAIWRVVPELQIVAVVGLEHGLSIGGGTQSPSPAMEYGLRFRFPLSPYSDGKGGAADWDGFRYPFGFMK